MTLGATPWFRRLGGAVVVAVAVVCSTVMTASPARAGSNVDEGQFLVAINRVRVGRGLTPLATDGQLINVARAWSAQMASANALSHNPSLATQVSDWRTLGENVGTGSSVDSIEAAFEASPHHFENMVDPAYRYVGIGIVEVGTTIWVTEDFKQSKSGLPTAAAPAPAPAPAPRPAPAPTPRPAPAPRSPSGLPRPAGSGNVPQSAVTPAAVAAVHTSASDAGTAPPTPSSQLPQGSESAKSSRNRGHGSGGNANAMTQLAASGRTAGTARLASLSLFAVLAAGAAVLVTQRRRV